MFPNNFIIHIKWVQRILCCQNLFLVFILLFCSSEIQSNWYLEICLSLTTRWKYYCWSIPKIVNLALHFFSICTYVSGKSSEKKRIIVVCCKHFFGGRAVWTNICSLQIRHHQKSKVAASPNSSPRKREWWFVYLHSLWVAKLKGVSSS